jgi:glycosyltransferase involved in cell wall biosynthesis
MMKLCVLGDNGSVHVQKWIKGLVAKGSIEMHIISFDRGPKFDGITYYPLRKVTGTKFDYFLNTSLVKKYLKTIAPDLVHAHHSTSYGYLAAASGFHPLVITGWGSDILDSPKNFFLRKILMNSLSKADAITVLSFFTQKKIAELTDQFVNVIPFGVDVSRFPVLIKEENVDIRIGTIRTLSDKYGVEYLIRAFAVLCDKKQNVLLDIVGDGPQRTFLENLCRELGVEKKVVFHGYVNQNTEFEKYISLLTSFDIFTILSTMDSDTFGVAAVEALACAVPVVATSVGGLPEVVDSEKTGIIVAPRDVEQTAAALERLILNKELRVQMGRTGRLKVEQQYNWKNNVDQMVVLYETTIDKVKKRTVK